MPLSDGCRFKRLPVAALECEGRRNYWEALVPRYEETFATVIHQDCVHNEYMGLVTRHLAPVPKPTERGCKALSKELRRISMKIRVSCGTLAPLPWGDIVASYSGAKRRTYEAAMRSLREEGLSTKRDAQISSFVKAERRTFDKISRPRIIQHRSPRYALELQSYIRVVEDSLMLLRADRGVGVPGTQVFAKRVDLHELADLIRRKFTQLGGDVVAVCLDAVAWDGHVSPEMLRLEHGFYESLFPGDSRLQRLLSWQNVNHCRSRHGLRYTCPGTRMSGDANTSTGNCVLMYACVRKAARDAGLRKWEALVNGDDVVVFLRRPDLARFTECVRPSFLELGQEVVVSTVFRSWTEVEMGRAKPILGSHGYFMGRDAFRIMSTAFVSHKHYHESKGGLRAVKTIAQGLLVLYQGVPVVQSFAENVVDQLEKIEILELALDPEVLRVVKRTARGADWTSMRSSPVTHDSRLAYYDAYGLGVDRQVQLEQDMRHLDVTIDLPWGPTPVLADACGRLHEVDKPEW